ncbi:MAG: alpha/beta hydrolase [Candidatus Omnitrophota bacterium]
MKRLLFWRTMVILCLPVIALAGEEAVDAKRKETLDQMLKMFPKSEAWEKWLQASGELPPDFDALPTRPDLPDPLRFENGEEVKTPEQWRQRREETLNLFYHYVIGTVPPPPGEVRAAEQKLRHENKASILDLVLEFGSEFKAKLHVELFIPAGNGPFPVFITQDNHRRWAQIAASRGYIGCVYAGADSNDDTGAFIPLWPECDWTKLTRRAWAASRCIDYLYTMPTVDKGKIALTGHSRNGKLSLIGAALDERITAVISSSSGAGGACSYRFFSEAQFGEGIEFITRSFPDWLHPRLRFFAGREEKLPIDQHQLLACIAPRPCLIATALNDDVESVWAIERNFYSVRRVYSLLGAEKALALYYRPGTHETTAENIERYLDWLDARFGRGQLDVADAPIYPVGKVSASAIFPATQPANLPLLQTLDGKAIAAKEEWGEKKKGIMARILSFMGEAAPYANQPAGEYGSEYAYVAQKLGRHSLPEGIEKVSLNFGDYIAGDLYYPADAKTNAKTIPAIVWLHPLSNSNGYVAGYRRGENIHLKLAQAGFAVFAFDHIGNGERLMEVSHFYDRYPEWSLFGKMVRDALSSLDAFNGLDWVDKRRIYVFSYGLGAAVGLHAAALDERIAGAVSIAGFTPMRLDTVEKGTGGLARWSQWLPLLPKMEAFIGQETRVPYDYHEALASIAPRPVLAAAPRIDGQHPIADVRACVEEAKQVYTLFGVPDNLQLMELDDYNHLSPEIQDAVIVKFKQMIGME